MKDINTLILRWLKFAEEDLIIAEDIFSGQHPIYRSICFQCQQSVEKNLKAYLIKFDVQIIKTHDIEHLINVLAAYDNDIEKFQKPTNRFTNYAVTYRYPDDFEDITKDEAEHAIKIATEIEKYITQKIVLN